MDRIAELHNQAMQFAEIAYIAKLKGDIKEASKLSRQAFEKEIEAAITAKKDNVEEPSLSILLRSAASLAIDCNEYREAEKLIAMALSGNPPNEIAEELRDLLEQVNFYRHLDLRGILLEPDEFQLSIGGGVVSFGMALMDILIEKFKYTKRLIFNTAGRLIGRPFVEISKLNVELYLSIPRPASYAISFKIGRPKEQSFLPGIDSSATTVVGELTDCLELFSRFEEDKLKDKIVNDEYYNDFISTARELAPDGEKINLVGFTAIKNGSEKKIALTRPKSEIPIKTQKKVESYISIQGKLMIDKALIIDDKGKEHSVTFPIGMTSDTILRMMEHDVIVTGTKTKKGVIKLEDIRGIYDFKKPKLPYLP